MAATEHPKVILVLSGKRKSGKDFISEILQKRLGVDKCGILRLSEPLKSQYAKEHGLCLEKLMDSTGYKETYRADMIQWGEKQRQKDKGYFIRFVINGPGSEKPIWIISDARRKSDIRLLSAQYFAQVVTVRIVASDEARAARGWVFCSGVDDAESECDLDSGVDFHVIISNNGDSDSLGERLNDLIKTVQRKLNS